VRIEWLPTARASARRFMTDQAGMRAIGAAVARLPDNPYPPEAFRWGEVLRLRAGLTSTPVLTGCPPLPARWVS